MERKHAVSRCLNSTVLTTVLLGCVFVPSNWLTGTPAALADDTLEITVTGETSADAVSPVKDDDAFGRFRPRPYDEIFLNELLNRGLFRLAQKHCEERLAHAEDVPPAQLAEWYVELIRVLSERALLTNGPEQATLWQQVEKLRDDYAKAHPDSPWQVLLDYQWAVGQLSRGEQLVLLAEDASGSATDAENGKMQAARKVLRHVIEQLETLAETLQNTTSTATARPRSKSKKSEDTALSSDGLTLWEAVLLQDKIRFQLLRAFQIQGETYPPQSVDRTNAIQQALQQVKTLSVLPSDSPLLLNVRLNEITCLRLLEDVTQAKKRIETMELHTLPKQASLRLTAEKIQLAILQGNLADGLQLIASLPPSTLGQCGELDCAILELHLARWAQALEQKDDTEAEKWKQQSHAVLSSIRRRGTPWWIRKAEILFQRSLAATAANGDLTVLLLRTESACRTGDLELAIPACELLWQKATEQKDAQTALKGSTALASLAYREKNLPLAIQWFRKPAKAFPQESDALKNHHYAIALAAKEVQQALQANGSEELPPADSSQPNSTPAGSTQAGSPQSETQPAPSAEQASTEALTKALDTYEALLIEHVRQFQKTDPEILSTLNQLENLLKLRKKWNSAVDVAMIIAAKTPANTAARTQALSQAMTAWDVYLRDLAEQKSDKLPTAIQGALKWGRNQELTPAQTLKLAEWQLNYTPDSTLEAAQLLQNLLDAEENAQTAHVMTDEERSSALCLLILAKISQGSSEDLPQLLRDAAGTSAGQTDALLTICRRMNRLMNQQPTPEARRKLAEMELQVLDILEKDQAKLPAKTREELDQIAAEAFLLTDHRAEAFARYEKMARQFPNRRDIQTTWARLLEEEGTRTNDATALQRALEQWREIEKRTQKQSPEWFEAKYHVAFLYMKTGKTENTVKIVKTLRALYPEMGGVEWKAKFEELLQGEK